MRWTLAALVLAGSIAAADPPRRIPANSVWVGSYRCSQGLTAVRLTISARPNGDAIASFEFGPHPDNPRVPRGEVQLRGTVEQRPRGHLVVKLQPDRWISRPGESWEMVGLTAESDAEQRMLEGKIDHQRCREITATRDE